MECNNCAAVKHRTWWHLSALLFPPFSHYWSSPIYTDACISPSLKYFIVSLSHSHNFLKYPIVGLLMALTPLVILLPPEEFWWNLSKLCSSNVPPIISVRPLVFGISISFHQLFLDSMTGFLVYSFSSCLLSQSFMLNSPEPNILTK